MPTSVKTDVYTRWMIRADLPEVLKIEKNDYSPWEEEDFFRMLHRKDTIGITALIKYQVVGFVIYQLNKRYIEVLRLAVHPSNLRKGVGTSIMNVMKRKLNVYSRSSLSIVVNDNNLPAHLFLKSQGLVAEKCLRNHFDGQDGYMFSYDITDAFKPVNRISRGGLL